MEIFLLGPTGAGKSRSAIEVAEQTGAEIVSMDAFQVYRGLDIGTGKPTKAEQNRVRHHMIDLVNPEENFTAADYARRGGEILHEVGKRSIATIWVGGNGVISPGNDRGSFLGPRDGDWGSGRVREKANGGVGRGDFSGRSRVVRESRYQESAESGEGSGSVASDGKKVVGVAGKRDGDGSDGRSGGMGFAARSADFGRGDSGTGENHVAGGVGGGGAGAGEGSGVGGISWIAGDRVWGGDGVLGRAGDGSRGV